MHINFSHKSGKAKLDNLVDYPDLSKTKNENLGFFHLEITDYFIIKLIVYPNH